MGMRKGVPHAKCSPLCAIKEKLQELWDRAYGCINKINDITPDGDGKFEINAGTGIVVSPDGNGIEISAASVSYTGVDPIVVDNDTLEISAPTVAVQDDLAAKADKATSLAGYGITDGVTTDTAQDITGEKKIRRAGSMMDFVNTNSEYNVVPSANLRSALYYLDKNEVLEGAMEWEKQTDGSHSWAINLRNKNGTWLSRTFKVIKMDDGTEYVLLPYRPYNPANIYDVVTIGSLAANPSVIHATGNEEINGSKRFVLPIRKVHANMTQGKPTSSFTSDLFSFQTANGQVISEIFMLYGTDGSVKLYGRNVNPDGTTGTSVLIATLRSAY